MIGCTEADWTELAPFTWLVHPGVLLQLLLDLLHHELALSDKGVICVLYHLNTGRFVTGKR